MLHVELYLIKVKVIPANSVLWEILQKNGLRCAIRVLYCAKFCSLTNNANLDFGTQHLTVRRFH